MLINRVDLEQGTMIVNYNIPNGTEVERLALTPVGGEQFYQTDGNVGTYNYVNGNWSVISNPNDISITGGSDIYYESGIYTFTISNFNSLSTYSAVTSGDGSATVSGAVVTYNARSTLGSDTLTITQDGLSINFNITVEVAPPSVSNMLTTLGNGALDNQNAYYMCVDSSLNTYLTGEDFAGTDKQCVVKFDKSGNILWQRAYPGPSIQEGITCDDTHVYVTGYISNQTYVNKLDGTDGTIVWELLFSNTYRGMSITENGSDLYIVGPNNGFQIMKLAKADGSIIWNKDFDASGLCSSSRGISYYNGFIYVAGQWSDGATVAEVCKVDASNGTVSWLQKLTETSLQQCAFEGLSVDSTGVYCSGWIRDNAGPNHALLVKYDLNGVRQWYRAYRDLSSINAALARYFDVYVTGTHVYAAGSTVGVNGTNSPEVPTFSKFDLNGNLIYHNTMDLASGDNGQYETIIVVNDSNIILAGRVQRVGSFGNDFLVIYNDDDAVSMTGALPTHTEFTFVDPTGVSDNSGLMSFIDATQTVTTLTPTLVPSTTTLADVAGTLIQTTSLY